MKVSEISISDVKNYLRLDETESADDHLLITILESATAYVQGYTGLPVTQTEGVGHYLDEYTDITLAVLVLCQDMYDNRAMYVEKNNVNKVVDSILGMHCHNLI